jgi:hypothetical protein
MDHRAHRIDARMRPQAKERVPQDGPARERLVLLGPVAAEAVTAP